MGGVPMLLMVAAAGIGYGWTPDGSGGVEYVVQIPPDKFDQLRASGEMSSTIAPEVRGSVSRIVIRIGDGPLPRQTPPGFASSVRPAGGALPPETQDLIDRDLRAVVPIPDLADSSGVTPIVIGPTGRPEHSGPRSLLKPAPQNAGGFALPDSLGGQPPSALSQTGEGFRTAANQFAGDLSNQAQQELRNAVDQVREQATAAGDSLSREAGDRIRGAVDSLVGRGGSFDGEAASTSPERGENRQQVLPPFIGSSPRDERPGYGPSSIRGSAQVTATPPQSNPGSWPSAASEGGRSFSADRGDAVVPPVSTRSNGPSTEPARSPNAGQWYAEEVPRSGATAGGVNAGNDGGTAGASRSDGNPILPPGADASSLDSLNGVRSGTTWPAPRDAGVENTGFGTTTPSPGVGPPTASGPRYGTTDSFGRMPGGMGYTDAQPSAAPRPYPTGRETRDAYGVDPRFGPADPSWRGETAGASGPAQGREAYESSESRNQRSSNSSGQYPPDATFFERTSRAPDQPLSRPRIAEAPRNAGSASDLPQAGSPRPSEPADYRSATNAGEELTQAPASDQGSARPDTSTNGRGSQKAIAAQPVFNGLLLFSFVGNIYLFFWLKTLREQFREVVANKRAARSAGSVS